MDDQLRLRAPIGCRQPKHWMAFAELVERVDGDQRLDLKHFGGNDLGGPLADFLSHVSKCVRCADALAGAYIHSRDVRQTRAAWMIWQELLARLDVCCNGAVSAAVAALACNKLEAAVCHSQTCSICKARSIQMAWVLNHTPQPVKRKRVLRVITKKQGLTPRVDTNPS